MSAKVSLEASETPLPFIRKVVLSNFKRFESLTVELNSDINIFAGDNEAGKSSVMSAIDLREAQITEEHGQGKARIERSRVSEMLGPWRGTPAAGLPA